MQSDWTLTPQQAAVTTAVGTSFLYGPVGSGKTTALQQRLLTLLERGQLAYNILVLVSELDHRQRFQDAVDRASLGPYADLKITTYNHMAMDMVELFWPLIAREAGFRDPANPPTVLTYDLAQLLMWRVVMPTIEEGAFADLRLRPQQIVSQVLDTLNRAALNSLTLDEAIVRQKQTWAGEPDRLRHLDDAGHAARKFRDICLQNSLLDLSLFVQTFDRQLVHHPEFQRVFRDRYRHVIVDNVEEQTPAGQNFVLSLLDIIDTAAIAYDQGGGYKWMLGSDAVEARQFQLRSTQMYTFETRFIAPAVVEDLADYVERRLVQTPRTQPAHGRGREAIRAVVSGRYRREMVGNLIAVLENLLDDGVAPADIAIVTPYLDGALRYTLTQALQQHRLPYRLLRRRTSPREEPRVRAWLVWLLLAHPEWNLQPTAFDVAEALTLSIDGLDAARAELLVEQLYRPEWGQLLPAADLPERVAARVGPELVGLVEELRVWLEQYASAAPIERFLHDLFHEMLAQPRFQPLPDLAGAAVCDWLVQSAVRLRRAARGMGLKTPADLGLAFVEGINQGLVTADPPDLGEPPDPEGITIATTYAYLLAGEPVRVQVWLEIAATGWWEIPRQPLSNAFVLAQSYDPEDQWTHEQDFFIRNELLARVIRGLCGRCREGIVLAHSELDRRGVRQSGALWRALEDLIAAERARPA